MQSIHHKNIHHKKTLWLLLITGFLLIAGAAGYVVYSSSVNKPSADDPVSATPAPARLSPEDAKSKQAYIDSEQTREPSKEEDADISVKATQEDDGSVTVRTKLLRVSEGTCTLTMRKDADALTKSAPIIYQAEYSSCAGFSIPSKELNPGTWQVRLSIESDKQVDDATTKVEVK